MGRFLTEPQSPPSSTYLYVTAYATHLKHSSHRIFVMKYKTYTAQTSERRMDCWVWEPSVRMATCLVFSFALRQREWKT